MDHSQRGCGVIRHDQRKVLSPNATVYVQGGRIELDMDLMTRRNGATST